MTDLRSRKSTTEFTNSLEIFRKKRRDFNIINKKDKDINEERIKQDQVNPIKNINMKNVVI